MGVDVYAYVGVGLMIDRGDLTRDTGRAACGHDKPPGAVGGYCSQCGRPWRDTVTEPVEGYDESEETYRGFDVRSMGGCEDGRVFVGRVVTEYMDGQHSFGLNGMRGECGLLARRDETGFDRQMADVREALASAPFYDEAKFGLWILTYCSY